jgi:hypothetical protein
MKSVVLALVFFLVLGTAGVTAQVQPRSGGSLQIAEATPTPTPLAAVPTAAVVLATPAPTLAPTPVTTMSTATATATTKGGMPVSGSVEMTVFLALLGLGLMGVGAFKALGVRA